jgi:mono/diheme cytochrome c family protein
MRNHRIVNLGVSGAVLTAAFGVSLTACTEVGPVRRVAPSGVAGASGEATGAAGTGFFSSPPINESVIDGGVAVGADGGSTCVGGVAVSPLPPMIRGGGITPQLPAVVTKASTPVPPLSGGTLLTLADAKTAAASDPDRDQVYLVDLSSNAVRATIRLQPGDEPGRAIQDPAGLLHVVLRRGGAIADIDPATGTVSARRAVCGAPRGIVYDKTAKVLQVACAGGELVSLPAAGGAATRTVMLDRDLRDIVVGPGGSLLVSTFRKAEVLVVGADGSVTSRLHPGSGISPTLMGTVQMRTPSVAWRMVSLDETTGSVAMLHQTGVTDLIDPAAGGYAGLKGCGGIVQAGISVLVPGSDSPPVASPMNSVSLAVDLAVSPDGQNVAVAVPGNAETQGMPTIFQQNLAQVTQNTGSPCGSSGSPVFPQPSGQVISVSYSRDGVLLAQTREPPTLWRADTGTVVALATDSRDDTGQDIFHVNAGGGLACASCHPEGGEDGRVWNFVCAGARRTQSIRGGISPTAPFHWDGSETNFSRLMDDVFSGRMAGPMLSDDQKTALQSWVDTIPAMPETAGLDAGAVDRGKTLFNDPKVACASCHAGTLLTNNATVDVGTGQALQVPSLRGVSWRAPFMHNGCATTLADRFGTAACSGGDKHGVTSTLTAAQVDDLTTYLQSL